MLLKGRVCVRITFAKEMEYELKLPYRKYLREMTVQAPGKYLGNGRQLFTFTVADSDSNPIPVLGSWDGNLKLITVQYEKFCILQCSHLVCSLNWNRNRNPDLAM